MKKNNEQRKGYKVEQVEESTFSDIKRELLMFAAITALLIQSVTTFHAMNETDLYGDIKYYKNITTEPNIRIFYSVPSGGTLTCTPTGYVGIQKAILEPQVDENGEVFYEVPEGFTTTIEKGKVIGVREVPAHSTPMYKAPEGYVLIGDTCYKIASQPENYDTMEDNIGINGYKTRYQLEREAETLRKR